LGGRSTNLGEQRRILKFEKKVIIPSDGESNEDDIYEVLPREWDAVEKNMFKNLGTGKKTVPTLPSRSVGKIMNVITKKKIKSTKKKNPSKRICHFGTVHQKRR